MKLRKRGELSMEVIIIAAIALLVLVILTILILRTGGELGKECVNIGGSCESVDSCTELGSGYQNSAHACPEDTRCCVAIDTGEGN